MLPVAEEYKKILLVEPAVADSITGDKWNKYIFRTGRNSSQDAIANAVALDQPGTASSRWRRTTPSAGRREGLQGVRSRRPRSCTRNTCRRRTTDFTAGRQRIIDKLKDQPGKKVIVGHLGRRANPFKIADMDLRSATASRSPPAATSCRRWWRTSSSRAWKAALYYYFGIPKNKVNEWLVARHYSQFKAPPDFFTAGGMAAGIAVVEALKKTGADTSTNKLIAAMEGMSFETPKGKMTFRKEDHQAMQDMYHFKIKVDPAFAWGVPELVREIKAEEMDVPIRNKR